MNTYGIIDWGSNTVRTVIAASREEAARKLEARGFHGIIVEVESVETRPARSSVPPPKENHFANAAKIAASGRSPISR